MPTGTRRWPDWASPSTAASPPTRCCRAGSRSPAPTGATCSATTAVATSSRSGLASRDSTSPPTPPAAPERRCSRPAASPRTSRASCGRTRTRATAAWSSEGLAAVAAGKRPLAVASNLVGGRRVLLAAVDANGIWRKDGSTWTKVSATAMATKQSYPQASLAWPAGSATAYLYDHRTGVWRSNDSGKTWVKIWAKKAAGKLVGYVVVDAVQTGRLWVSTADGVYRLDGAGSGTVGNGVLKAVKVLTALRPGPLAAQPSGGVMVAVPAAPGTAAALLRTADGGSQLAGPVRSPLPSHRRIRHRHRRRTRWTDLRGHVRRRGAGRPRLSRAAQASAEKPRHCLHAHPPDLTAGDRCAGAAGAGGSRRPRRDAAAAGDRRRHRRLHPDRLSAHAGPAAEHHRQHPLAARRHRRGRRRRSDRQAGANRWASHQHRLDGAVRLAGSVGRVHRQDRAATGHAGGADRAAVRRRQLRAMADRPHHRARLHRSAPQAGGRCGQRLAQPAALGGRRGGAGGARHGRGRCSCGRGASAAAAAARAGGRARVR